ncbi:MAG TPA: vanadium-dependent haloperoxidase [Acidimicrobiales bacterium]|nr:vanadium-dependent haloperoxidase [Acidimicrobiales bacterium]
MTGRRRGSAAGTRLAGVVVALGLLALPASRAVPATADDHDAYRIDGCTPGPVPTGTAAGGEEQAEASTEDWSIARVWDEATLDAIRRDVPAPTVHARNLFHVAAAMWDAWAAYEPDADGYFVDEKVQLGEGEDIEDARAASISYAAYRILLHRYSLASGMEGTFGQLASTMEALCYRVDFADTTGDSPAALGNRIAATVIERGRDDGALEAQRYVDTSYRAVNAPMVVTEPGATMRDPNRWQPLALARLVAQNGLPLPGNVQRFVGPQWGSVRAFALPPSPDGLPADPGPPPRLDDPAARAAFGEAAIDVLRASSELDPADGTLVDISPAAWGDNPLGTNDGGGHDRNPATGEPYAPNRVLRGDFARALAEFWADGPQSETPPGHWNTIANTVSDTPGFQHRIGGEGPVVDRLEWDVKLYLALNGAVHDAAVAAWGVKGYYDSARPISMIRYMGGLGQSSDPDGLSYHPDGLPLVRDLVEVITPASSAPGQRHAHLADHVGEVAVRAWRGSPEDPTAQASGAAWIRAVDWVPYQRPTFVTPAFAGYVSGHSTFSRAAAEVMTAITGDPYFPGGLSEWTLEPGGLVTERGPTQAVRLQWATYYDAADHAGISRIFGGIHITADDFAGRRLGSQCGDEAWMLAQHYFDGTADAG